MASEEGFVATTVEEQQAGQQPRGCKEQCAPAKHGKSKAPVKETMDSRVGGLERSVTNISSVVGDLSDQVDNLIHENA